MSAMLRKAGSRNFEPPNPASLPGRCSWLGWVSRGFALANFLRPSGTGGVRSEQYMVLPLPCSRRPPEYAGASPEPSGERADDGLGAQVIEQGLGTEHAAAATAEVAAAIRD